MYRAKKSDMFKPPPFMDMQPDTLAQSPITKNPPPHYSKGGIINQVNENFKAKTRKFQK